MKKFKFDNIPAAPGVYLFINKSGEAIYVGKSVNLKRRLQQYKNAKRCKKHKKMWMIKKQMHQLQIHPCDSELDALLLENKLIQQLNPKFNVDGAFSFLYPFLGYRIENAGLTLIYTCDESKRLEYTVFGSFRSMYKSKAAYLSLLNCLEYLGHKESTRLNRDEKKFTLSCHFRQVSSSWIELLHTFFMGQSAEFLEKLVLFMLTKPSAIKRAAKIQDDLDELKRFYKFEAKPLRVAMQTVEPNLQFISQNQRDSLFLKFRHQKTKSINPRHESNR